MSKEAIDRHLAALDEAAAGLVTAYYITGSVALGDFHPESSDIDFIAVVSRDLGTADLDMLDAVHRALPDRPHMDGVYLSQAQFDARLSGGQAVPYTLDGKLHREGEAFQLNPVTWAELAQCGMVIRGEAPRFEVDLGALKAFNRENLRSYWRPFIAEARAKMAERASDALLPYPQTLPWLVLGPPRLHFTIATGEIASKTTAGRYGAALFPAWAYLVEKALAVRNGDDVPPPTAAELADAADFAEAVTYDALSDVTKAG